MYIKYFLFFLSLAFFSGCNEHSNIDEIKVGMTYDEVESMLRKPTSIIRGVNELYYDEENILENFRNYDWDTTQTDPKRWLYPMKIKTIGSLIYVNWVYNETKRDTFYTMRNSFKTISGPVENKIPVYYIGNRKVSLDEYKESNGYEYRSKRNTVITRSLYEVYKNAGTAVPEPKRVGKRIEYVTVTTTKAQEVIDRSNPEKYEVISQYCVLFDASSGRVTNSGYFPITIKLLN